MLCLLSKTQYKETITVFYIVFYLINITVSLHCVLLNKHIIVSLHYVLLNKHNSLFTLCFTQ
jgi:hypothetical protein